MKILLLSLLLLVLPSFLVATTASPDGFLQCLATYASFAANSSTIVFTSGSAAFGDVLSLTIRNKRFETSATPRPAIIIKPTDISHFGPVVVCARSHDLQLRIRSGGHDYEGLSYVSLRPFVVLDMINFSGVTVDTATRTAWIQSGATLGQVYYYVGRSSSTLAFPGGVCPTVGVGGHFSGGGYGTLHRYAGLAADQVIDVVVVDAEGQVRDRRSIGEDVFWAIRGGGGNTFGIVVAWRVNLVTVPEKVTTAAVSKMIEENAAQYLVKWQQIADKLPDELFVRVVMYKWKNATLTTVRATFNIFYIGSSENALSLVDQTFPEFGLKQADLTEMGWVESTVQFADYPPGSPLEVLLSRNPLVETKYLKGKSDYVTKAIPESGLEGMWNWMLQDGIEETFAIFTPYGGKMARIPSTSIPFPHREGNIYKIQYLVFWSQDREEQSRRHIEWIRGLYDYMTPFVSTNPRAAYVNYRDLDVGANNPNGVTTYGQAKVWGEKYFKGNFDRLVTIKTIFDPTNFFGNEQSIPAVGKQGKPKNEAATGGLHRGHYCLPVLLVLVLI